MKRTGTLALALMVSLPFATATLTSTISEAKTHAADTAKKKKKKKKKTHVTSVRPSSSEEIATSKTGTGRSTASTGYDRASLYMTPHEDTAKRKKKKKKRTA